VGALERRLGDNSVYALSPTGSPDYQVKRPANPIPRATNSETELLRVVAVHLAHQTVNDVTPGPLPKHSLVTSLAHPRSLVRVS
jgi:hypothetical protein